MPAAEGSLQHECITDMLKTTCCAKEVFLGQDIAV